jgi:rhodanese-related sulfurtransferase
MDKAALYSYQTRPTQQPNMSTITTASLKRISNDTLSKTLLATPLTPTSAIAVIDVRDSDHVGGHINGSIHAPTPTLDWKMPELVRQLRDKETVVFHCALSQERGPKAALAYLRERERMFSKPAAAKDGEGEGKDRQEEKEEEKQKVVVLDGGFVKWQEK